MNTFYRVLIVMCLLVYCLAFQGTRSLWEPDGGRYSAVAMEMLRHGNWLTPQLHPEQPHMTKPPLTYWVIAASISLLGRNEFAARLVSVLSYFFSICFVYLLGRLFLPRKAWLAPLVYASFLMPFVASNLITTDGLLTMWETAAVCAYAYALWGRKRETAHSFMLLMWGAFGLAFLTKGPPALLPLLAIIIHRYWPRRSTDFPRLQWVAGLAIMLAIGLSWFLLIIARQPELIRYFIVDEIYGRVVTGEHGRNSEWYKAFTIYLPVLILGTLPWTFLLVRHMFKTARTLFHSRRQPMHPVQQQDIFLYLWFLCPLLVFLVSSSRLPLYILPLFVPLALLTARGLEAISFSWDRKRLAWISAWFLLLVSVRIIGAQIPSDKDDASIAQAIQQTSTAPFSEIVFYATSPINGLNFYLDKEVEKVTEDALEDELAEKESRLWVLRPKTAPAFLAATAKLGRQFRQVGRIEERYLLFQESASDGRLLSDN